MIALNRAADASQSSEEDGMGHGPKNLQLRHLQAAIESAAKLLPIPGPITAFAFLNTLNALEDLPFEEGISRGAQLYGCQPWLSEEQYRAYVARGRIRMENIHAVLREDLGPEAQRPVGPRGTRFELHLAMLTHPVQFDRIEDLRWFVAERHGLPWLGDALSPETHERLIERTRNWVVSDLLNHETAGADSPELISQILADVRAQFGARPISFWNQPNSEWEALCARIMWRVSLSGVRSVATGTPAKSPLRIRDLLLQATGEDSDLLVNEMLVRFCAAFSDQGLAAWELPNREQGFYRSFCRLYRRRSGPPHYWTADLAAELMRLSRSRIDPLNSIRESLTMLGYSIDEWDEVVRASLFSLRGWAGMLWQMETRPDRVAAPCRPGTLLEFLAVRLVLERIAIEHIVQKRLRYRGQLSRLREMLLARWESPRARATSNVRSRSTNWRKSWGGHRRNWHKCQHLGGASCSRTSRRFPIGSAAARCTGPSSDAFRFKRSTRFQRSPSVRPPDPRHPNFRPSFALTPARNHSGAISRKSLRRSRHSARPVFLAFRCTIGA